MTYMGYQTAGHFDEGVAFLDLLQDLLPAFRQFARDFYGAPGAAVPGVMSLQGQPSAAGADPVSRPRWAHGTPTSSTSTGGTPVTTGFSAPAPIPGAARSASACSTCSKPDANGVLQLPLSSSPEIFDNSRRAFLIPNTNYDLMSLKMLFLALAEMADACGDLPEPRRWSHAARRLGDCHVRTTGRSCSTKKRPSPPAIGTSPI